LLPFANAPIDEMKARMNKRVVYFICFILYEFSFVM
jgi:hypothetical protein